MAHFIGMSGLHGFMPDYTCVSETPAQAAESLAEIHDLTPGQVAYLAHFLSLELPRRQRVGAEYCEIQECDCADPAVHEE